MRLELKCKCHGEDKCPYNARITIFPFHSGAFVYIHSVTGTQEIWLAKEDLKNLEEFIRNLLRGESR